MPDTVTGLVTTDPGPGERIRIASSGRAGPGGLPTVAAGGTPVSVAPGAGTVSVGAGGRSVGEAEVPGSGEVVIGTVTMHATVVASSISRDVRRIDLMAVTFLICLSLAVFGVDVHISPHCSTIDIRTFVLYNVPTNGSTMAFPDDTIHVPRCRGSWLSQEGQT